MSRCVTAAAVSRGFRMVRNTLPMAEPCHWCLSERGDIHSPACPHGARSKRIKEYYDTYGESPLEPMPFYCPGKEGSMTWDEFKAMW